ncbi:THO complex subunit 7 homolog [Portunus trituberculatus]|uniref:THO complex subunit 7 homolog n=1 Tax=Portunus trituberculatus TaxID=210409 RepID=UPI001E1CF0D1|nr:THO complex subunit 7 homolog [Portunus trituberculatus]
MGDEEIIRRRLMIDGDGTGDARLMMMFMKQFIKWCTTDDSPQESQNQYDRLLTQLATIEHSSLKWKSIVDMNNEEIKNYELLREETSNNVEKACVAIEEAKQELEEARQVRRNRLEYDALARLIKEHPPRSDTANKLAHLTQHLHSLKSKRDQLEEKISLRQKQLHVLVTSLHQLKQTLIHDNVPSQGDDLCVIDEVIDLTDTTTVTINDSAMDTA